MKTWIKQALAGVMALGAGTVLFSPAVFAEDAPPPIATYSVDLVSDYVIRGADQYLRVFQKDGKEHTAFNVSPAIQPSLTLLGSGGFSLNLWGSWALTNRADDNKNGFLGLGRDDELDYTFAYDWSNRMGGFTAAIIYYTYFDSCYNTGVKCDKSNPGNAGFPPDARITWAMPWGASMHPFLAYTANEIPGGWYATFGVSGGEKLVWGATFDEVGAGPKDLTLKIGYVMGDLTVALLAAYRPNPELVGPYAKKDGKYQADPGNTDPAKAAKTSTYPSTIAWLDFTYSGSVAPK